MFSTLVFALSVLAISQADAKKSIHYEGLGTFHDDDFYDPMVRPFTLLPESPEVIDPHFQYYNRDHPDQAVFLKWNDINQLKSVDFKPRDGTKIMVHGLTDNPNYLGPWMMKMKKIFFQRGDYNVIIVDWSKGNFFPYTQAVANTEVVGYMLGHIVKNLSQIHNASLEEFHLFGHSLGCHVIAFTGKFNHGKIGHITAFDPAGPYFERLPFREGRLWHTDAQFVESIHTDARELIPDIGLGMWEPCSHVDVYVNGGKQQPGCDIRQIVTILKDGLIQGFRNIGICNHDRSIAYYLDILQHENIPAKVYQCESYDDFENMKCQDCKSNPGKCVVVGLLDYKKYRNMTNYGIGKRYFMVTAAQDPLIGFQYIIRLNMDKNENNEHVSQHGKVKIRLVSVNGDQDEFDFNDNDGILHYGKSYHHARANQIEPSKIAHIEFQWRHGIEDPLNLFHGKMYIDNIELVGLTGHDPDANPVSIKFVPETNGIPNGGMHKFIKKT